MQVTHLDCVSRARKSTADALAARVREKEDKYLVDCKALGNNVVPFIISTDGVPSEPANSFINILADVLGGCGKGSK